jgi:hypothetical protein
MIEELPALVNANAALVRRGRWTDADLLIEIGQAGWIVRIRAGRVEVPPVEYRVTAYDFAIRGTEDAWRAFWAPLPPPRRHDISALVREGSMRLDGNLDLMMANFLYLKLMLETLRGRV